MQLTIKRKWGAFLDSKFSNTLIVGAGAMAINHHLPRFIDVLGCKHIDILETNPQRRAELIKRFDRDAKIELIDQLPDPKDIYDLVLISTPPKFHVEYFELLQANAGVFLIEKPMTMNADEARIICQIASEKEKKVFVHLIRRTLKAYTLIKTLWELRLFGELKSVRLFEGGVFDWNAVSMGSFSNELNGGGVLMDTGPHAIDLLFQVFENIELVESRMDALAPAIEANCVLKLSADKGVPVLLSLTRNRNFSNETVFDFENAEVRAGVRNNNIKVNLKHDVSFIAVPTDITSNQCVNFSSLIDDYYNKYLLSGINNDVAPEDSLKIAELIDAAYSNAELIREGF